MRQSGELARCTTVETPRPLGTRLPSDLSFIERCRGSAVRNDYRQPSNVIQDISCRMYHLNHDLIKIYDITNYEINIRYHRNGHDGHLQPSDRNLQLREQRKAQLPELAV